MPPGSITIELNPPVRPPVAITIPEGISIFKSSPSNLSVALGQDISGNPIVVDLAKMPHLLMAGATGQGKSVGLNAVLTSLLYKKHPAEIKFVLVDPKKVELNIYNKIERHYLAKLPDTDDAIITDNTKVIHTLNSLCIEMDNRYELLKNANCRNLKEYNQKYRERKLNPNHGHSFLPYIVLVVDEFADLIMTAGKEVETPIARLAQLARAIGIHLIIATQRPSVNVITGVIKANFPARIAFRVTSKIDSRTILDQMGAESLLGQGDMLVLTPGSGLPFRVHGAFVSDEEVSSVVNYLKNLSAPNYDNNVTKKTSDMNYGFSVGPFDQDKNLIGDEPLYEEALKVILKHRRASISFVQRHLRIGYNRAARIIDMMEADGIVSKANHVGKRDVL